MRRWSFVIACGLLVAAVASPLLAQHSNGYGSAGHTSYSGTGMMGATVHAGGPPPGAWHPPFSTFNSAGGQLNYPTSIGLQRTYSGFTGINRGAIPNEVRRDEHREHEGRNRGFVGAYFAYPFYYSGFADYGSPYTYYDRGQDPAAQTAELNANLLGEQVAHLSEEVDALRKERQTGIDVSGPDSRYAPPSVSEQDARPVLPLTLILRNGKQVQLKSYAIMGRDIWDFSSQPAKRIALSSIDLNASRSATDDNGGEFPDIR